MHDAVLAITIVLLAVIVVAAAAHLIRWVWFPSDEDRALDERWERDQEALRRGLAVRALRGDVEI